MFKNNVLFRMTVLAAWATVSLFACSDLILDADERADNTHFVASEAFHHEFDAAEHVRFRLQGINGDITISGAADLDQIVVRGEKRVGSESIADAEAHLAVLQVVVIDSGDVVFAETRQPEDSRGRNYTVDYHIFLPPRVAVFAFNLNGNVQVDSMRSAVNAGNLNGNIGLNGIQGNTYALLVNGNINADVIMPVNGFIDLTTVNGRVDLMIPDTTSATLAANVVNGTVRCRNLSLRNLTQTSRSMHGTLNGGRGRITLRTTNGDIDVAGY